MAVRRNASQWLELVKWRLRKEGLLNEQETLAPEQPAFIAVRLVSHDREFAPERGIDQHVDIVVDERNTVRVLPGFDGVTLRRVLEVLGAQEAR